MGLKALTSPGLAPIRHGFFTRQGGVSGGIYAGLNCGAGSRDDPGHVAENRARAAADLGIGSDRLLSLHQCHSDIAHRIDAPWPGDRPRGDAMVTATPGLGLGILTADCAPVLFADPAARVIGAAHAGWRGALDGIVESTLDAMCATGATRGNIRAAIGPVISQSAYEVGPEFFDRFRDEAAGYEVFFINGKDDRMLFDLPRFVLHRLREAGIVQCEWIGHCTYSAPHDFYSYRRATHAGEPDYGRLLSAIVLD